MKALTTILAATALCAGMMMLAVYRAGDLPTSASGTGLTAAFILGADDMAPDAVERSDARLDSAGPRPNEFRTRRADRVAAR